MGFPFLPALQVLLPLPYALSWSVFSTHQSLRGHYRYRNSDKPCAALLLRGTSRNAQRPESADDDGSSGSPYGTAYDACVRTYANTVARVRRARNVTKAFCKICAGVRKKGQKPAGVHNADGSHNPYASQTRTPASAGVDATSRGRATPWRQWMRR